MNDQGGADALRGILFNPENKINWQSAANIIKKYMPELKIS